MFIFLPDAMAITATVILKSAIPNQVSSGTYFNNAPISHADLGKPRSGLALKRLPAPKVKTGT